MSAPAPRYVLGIDAGGTKTLGLLASESGNVVAEARGPGCSLQTHGELLIEKVVSGIIDNLGGLHPIAALCLGIGGVDRPEDEVLVRNILRRLGYRETSKVVSHALVALIAGAPERVGVVLVAGTGAIAYGVDRAGKTARAGGLGPMLSDEGSGYWLGREALRAIVRKADGRGPDTALAGFVFSSLGVHSAADLVPLVHEKGLPRYQIAALAGLVQKAKDRGDAVATELLDQAGRELALAVRSVAGALRFGDEPFPVVLAGGVFKACPSLPQLVAASLELPTARLAPLEAEPANGALALAREMLKK
jgi:N-acetylglucosamine kinase-like BadF-type ATPase